MNQVIFQEVETVNGLKEYAIIDRGNGEFTSMPKAVWDELEAKREQSGTLS